MSLPTNERASVAAAGCRRQNFFLASAPSGMLQLPFPSRFVPAATTKDQQLSILTVSSAKRTSDANFLLVARGEGVLSASSPPPPPVLSTKATACRCLQQQQQHHHALRRTAPLTCLLEQGSTGVERARERA